MEKSANLTDWKFYRDDWLKQNAKQILLYVLPVWCENKEHLPEDLDIQKLKEFYDLKLGTTVLDMG